MDKTIRRNEICIIGLPRCDFVFSSTRSCFIGYGFEESPLEMTILRRLLQDRGIQPAEAGGTLAPAQNAFCSKICSKIIAAQFCAVLLNNEQRGNAEIPNANVNMEYGLMLGFNKYVIPFQRSSQKLPFNVAGLDTIKYSDRDFERLAGSAVDQAVKETQQDTPPAYPPDQVLEVFLLTRKALITPLNTEGDRSLYQIGSPLGFALLNDFAGMHYIFLGNFCPLRPEVVLSRLGLLNEILDDRRATLPERVKAGIGTPKQAGVLEKILRELQIWIVVTSNEDKATIQASVRESIHSYTTEVFSIEDIRGVLEKLVQQRA